MPGDKGWAQRHPKLMRVLQATVVILVAILVISECSQDDAAIPANAEPKSVENALSADQKSLQDQLRKVWNWNSLCVDGLTAARETFHPNGENQTALLDGYDKLKSAASECENFSQSAADFQFSKLSKPLDPGKSEHALVSCRAVAPNAVKAIRAAVRWLDDGGGQLSQASEIRRSLDSVAGDHGMCGAALNDLAKSYGIPASEGRFHVRL